MKARIIFAIATLTGTYLLLRKAVQVLVQAYLDADRRAQSDHVKPD